MGIGRRIKERREEIGLRVADVARQAGLKPTTLYDLEREEQHSTTRLHALCKVLGLNPEWVETGRGTRIAVRESRRENVVESDHVKTIHGMQITTEEVEFGIEWGKLDEPHRSSIREQVLVLVASQVRRRRAAKDVDPPPVQPPPTRKQ
jgi:transcriptional regulator with XRE-family HTH domain